MGNYQNITGWNPPTISIRAHGLKGCLILLKNESCQNCILTIPLCRWGRDEATGENRVKIGRRNSPHAPSRVGEVTAHAHRLAPRVTRVFFTRMSWPNPNTRWPNPRARPGWVWRHHVQLACHVSDQSPDTSAQWDSPATSSASSRVELSRLWAKPSREPMEKILCNGVYVQPDLRLNLGR